MDTEMCIRDRQYWSRLQKGETITDEQAVYTPDMVLGPPRKGIKLTYCTDTRPVPAIVENASGSDLFICEGMYGEKDKDAKAREHKHMTFYEAAKLARDAQAVSYTHLFHCKKTAGSTGGVGKDRSEGYRSWSVSA